MLNFRHKNIISYSLLTVLSVASTNSLLAEESANVAPIVIEASALEQSSLEMVAPFSVLHGQELEIKAKPSLGETLASEPGVSSSYFGPIASRPIIRGLGGEKIKILENGTSSADLSAISPDHASMIDSSLAQQIEIIRGPATILHGASAVGGVVNIADDRVPETIPTNKIEGDLEIRGSTGDLERAIVGRTNFSAGPIVFHLDGGLRKTDDIKIPGFARTSKAQQESELEYPEPKGELPFSDSDTDSITFGSSYVADSGFFGIALSDYNSLYGVPNGEENISIDAQKERIDLKGKLFEPNQNIKSISADIGIVDYKHTEYEGEEVGTKFSNEEIDTRFQLAHEKLAGMEGVIGFQISDSDFKAEGEEAYQPPTDSQFYSMFLFEELPLNSDFRLQAGARLDWASYDSDGFEANSELEEELGRSRAGAQSKDFNSFSQTLGLVWDQSEKNSWALSLANSERAPSGQELFADGPHVATAAYEIGDTELEQEKSLGIDLTNKRELGKSAELTLSAFYTRYWDYIGLNPDGTEALDFDVYRFENQNAQFYGAESKLTYYLSDSKMSGFSVDLQPDYVFAEDTDTDKPLPRIPPLRLISGINYKLEDNFYSRLEVNFNNSQDRNAEFETETDSYTFINAYLSKTLKLDGRDFEIFLRGSNLTNEKGRQHTSFLKEVAPLPGVSVTSGIRFRF
jgi:iron complex outermembrane receptor protein